MKRSTSLKTPVSGLNIELAPVHIYTYADMGAYKGAQARLKKLVDVGALNATHGWSHKFVDEFVWPNILKPLADRREPAIGGGRRGIGRRHRDLPGYARCG